MTSLEALGQPVNQWETIILHLAKKKLDFVEQRDWQNIIKDRNAANMPRIEEFLKFLTDRCNTLRVLNQGKEKAATTKSSEKKKSDKRVTLAVTAQECKYCKRTHSIYKCEVLQKLSPVDRKKEIRIIRALALLGTLLHRDTESQTKAESEPDTTAVVTYCADKSIEKSRSSKKIEDEEYITNIHCVHKQTSSIILSTARVHAYDIDGNPQICRVLLDPGSQLNLITESFARQLKLSHKTEHRPISGINLAKTNASKVVTVRIESLQEEFSTNLKCLILPNITEQLPQSRIDVTQIAMPKSIRLADPVFDKPGQINLLVGAGLYWKILIGDPRNQVPGQPALQNTRLGWIIGGEIPGKQ
ncbi:uncharacterized protein [Temnothorax nylanderi]|uniref:uncharacterized protein n=1 Tax=Temnothorax nylanderi TaxID=102681 RepID=UPI003A8639B6